MVSTPAFALDYSADTHSVINGREINGKIYARSDRWRIEAEIGDRHQISILRKDKKLIWHIAAQQKQYAEFPMKDDDIAKLLNLAAPGEYKREKLGAEKINNRPATKYKVFIRMQQREGAFIQWIDDEYKFPVKSEDEKGTFTSVITNITPGPQADALFELPTSLTPYTIMPGKSGK